jgi:hypothetical protein
VRIIIYYLSSDTVSECRIERTPPVKPKEAYIEYENGSEGIGSKTFP